MISRISTSAMTPPVPSAAIADRSDEKISKIALSAIKETSRESSRPISSLKIKTSDIETSDDSLSTGAATGGGSLSRSSTASKASSFFSPTEDSSPTGPDLKLFEKNSIWIDKQIEAISKKAPPIAKIEELFTKIIRNAEAIGSKCTLAGRVSEWDSGVYAGFSARKEEKFLETLPKDEIYQNTLLHKMPEAVKKLIFSPLFSVQDTFEDKTRFLALAEINGQKCIIEATVNEKGELFHLFARPLNYPDGKINPGAKREYETIAESLRSKTRTRAGMKKLEGSVTVEGITFNSKTNEATFIAPLGKKELHDNPRTPKHVKEAESAVGFEPVIYKIKLLKEVSFGS